MRAIIRGMRYDTDKAELIGEYRQGYVGDFGHFEEGLYRTPRSGTYFLAGIGGPMTRYAKRVDNTSWTGSERIIPLSRDEAFAWAQEYLPADVVETEFSDLVEEA